MGSAAVASSPKTDIYANEPFVIESLHWIYVMNTDGTGTAERKGTVRIQSDAGLKAFGVLKSEFASASEHVDFRSVRVRHKDGSITETPGSGAIEQPERVTQEAPFYSDLKQVQLPVKDLRMGDTLEWDYVIVRTKSEAPGEFWYGQTFVTEGSVVLEETLELKLPANKVINVWTNPSANIKPTESTEGAEKVYRWTGSQLKPTSGREAEEKKKADKTRVWTEAEYQDYRFGKLPTAAWTTFKSWVDIGTWYRGLEGDRALPDEEIKKKVAEITAGKSTEEDKVRAIYAYVSSQIRYIGVAFGVGRYQPHEAAEVLHNQYGDCKDKETLLASMLAAIGVSSDAVLIGSDIRFNDAVPSPGAFNHLITRAKVNGEEIWLDPTAEIAPYRMLYNVIRDKDALVIPSKGAAFLTKTPVSPPFPSEDIWTANGTLDEEGISESHIKLTVRGDDELSFRSTARSVGAAEYDETGTKIASNLGYVGTLNHVAFSKPDATLDPFVFEFDYHREKAGDWDNLKTLPQLAPVELPKFDEKTPPVHPIYLGNPRTELSISDVKIPEGWAAQLPEAVHERTPFASYDQTYKFENGTVHTERKLIILKTRLPESEWAEYQKWTKAIDLGFEPYIKLIRGGNIPTNSDKPNAVGHVSSEEAENLITGSFDASEKRDYKTAETLLKRAKSLDEKARHLWASYGVLNLDRSKYSDAIDAFHKELELYPNAYEIYPVLIETQQLKGDKSGKLETARSWVAVDPKSSKAQIALARVLLDQGDGAGSLKAAEAAVTLTPEDRRGKDEELQATLGRAQLKAGQTDKGVATIITALKATDSPGEMNDLDYYLAEAKQSLSVAEEHQKMALEKMSNETKAWTLDESVSTLMSKTDHLVKAWDTMGWILFQEGKPADALNYLEAAWENTSKDLNKDHVKQARVALPSTAKEENAPDYSNLKMRTIKLGPLSGKSNGAEYKMLISHNQVERVLPVKDDKTIEGIEPLIKAAKLPQMVPNGSDAKIVRGAWVNCSFGKCEMLLENID